MDLLHRTQAMLATSTLCLHKMASSHTKVMEAFLSEDHASRLHNLPFNKGLILIQQSLGVYWELTSDTFTFQVTLEEKPLTRRGVLSVTNSLYNLLGIAAPASPATCREQARIGRRCYSLRTLKEIKLPCSYSNKALKKATRRELLTFGGASEMAIKGVSYLRIAQNTVNGSVSFVLGRAKLTPAHATTIPCLELCAAVLGVELSELIYDELEQKPDSVS